MPDLKATPLRTRMFPHAEKPRPHHDSLLSPTLDPPVLSILVPVYNEAETVSRVIESIQHVHFTVRIEIIAVDDGSTDGSAELLRSLPPVDTLRVVFHESNLGKGAAVSTALRHARGQFVVIQDADLELDPSDLLPLLDAVYRYKLPVCYGSRFLGSVSQFHRMPTYWANRFLNLACNLMNGIHITDMNTCYKMMRTDVARRVNLISRGFEMEPEITTKLARMGIRISERPITYRPRTKNQGKKIRSTDFLRYLTAMVRFRLTSSDSIPPPAPPPSGPAAHRRLHAPTTTASILHSAPGTRTDDSTSGLPPLHE